MALLLAVVMVLVITVVITLRRPLPDYSGQTQVPGLGSEVSIQRDERGIPQVYASTSRDLFYAQGYVHAQDRFFQMDYRRHVASGRLSELVGPDEEALQSDRVVRTLGWRRVAEKELPLLEPSTRNYLQSYADGVNAYIDDRAPAELSSAYSVIGLQGNLTRIERWTPVDSLTWLKAMAWDLRPNYDDELGRAITYGQVDDEALVAQLYPPYPVGEHLPIVPGESVVGASVEGALKVQDADRGGADQGQGKALAARQEAARPTLRAVRAGAEPLLDAQRALDAIPTLLGRGDGIGSNSWVVSGEHTVSGQPLLANDPHLAPGIPSTWYQVGLHCTQVGAACPFEVAGYSFAGLPGVVIGHNAEIAWGLTTLGADVSDFFLEDVEDGSYLRDGVQVELDTRTEMIKRSGADDEEITIRSTGHGPIISDVLDPADDVGAVAPVTPPAPYSPDGYAVSLSWTAMTPGRTADAIFQLNAASDWDDFRAAAELFEFPSQNLIYADTQGHIGYQAAGKIPVRLPGPGLGQNDGTWPRLGWDSRWDWAGYIPFEVLPQVLDPEEGFIVAANQLVTGPPYTYRLTADWDYGYRSQRIRDVLTEKIEAGDKLSSDDMSALQMDTHNGFAPVLVPSLLAAPPSDVDTTAATRKFTAEAITMLRDWDYSQGRDSAPAAYYNAVWSNVLRLTFQDQLPEEVRPDGGDRWYRVVGALLAEPDNVWWDDQRTPTIVETRDQVLGQAMKDARLELTASLGKDPLEWEWGKLHTLTLEHKLLGGEAAPWPVRALFSSDRMQLGGGSAAVQANGWDASQDGSYTVDWVPSMRMVVDLSDLDASTWVDLTGISGHPWSAHHGDQTQAWADGETFLWPFSREAVDAAAQDTLTLSPIEPAGG